MTDQKNPRRHPYGKSPQGHRQKNGPLPLPLCLLAITVAIVFAGGATLLKITSDSAIKITTHHDLELFSDFQKFYYDMNRHCIGEQGESIRNDGLPSTLVVKNYALSRGIAITIIAGDPEDPYNEENPYTMQAKHIDANTVYEYSFATDTIIER